MKTLLMLLAALGVAHASAQHPGASHGHRPTGSSYAGEESREIKALSAEEQRGWREGSGAGLARAAELNGHPGPMHVLEHAEALRLSASQKKETEALMARHKEEVRRLGAELVEAERELDQLFRTRRATAASIRNLTDRIGSLQARIRASHLITHLQQTAMLQPEQVAAYDRLRGYTR